LKKTPGVYAHICTSSMITFTRRSSLDQIEDGSIILTAHDLPLWPKNSVRREWWGDWTLSWVSPC
jgi:hypothetical protein